MKAKVKKLKPFTMTIPVWYRDLMRAGHRYWPGRSESKIVLGILGQVLWSEKMCAEKIYPVRKKRSK